ncbi:MAG: hypothetical protein P8X90_29015 [Desulfobacterales bacterium]
MDATLFKYEVSPQKVYITTQDQHPSIELLTLTITNETGEDVAVKYFGFIFAVGCSRVDPADERCNKHNFQETNETAITNDAASISASAIQEGWSISRAGAPNSFQSCPGTLKANASVVFQFGGIQINATSGVARIEVHEVTDRRRLKFLPVTKVRSALEVKSFAVRPPVIDVGQSATLSWETVSASEATLYTIPQTPPDPGQDRQTTAVEPDSGNRQDDQRCKEQRVQRVELSGSCAVRPKSSTLYILEARGAGPVMTAQQPLPVESVGLRFEAVKQNIIQGETVYLKWTTTNAVSATLYPDEKAVPLNIPDKDHPQGWPVTPEKDTVYQLEAQGTNSSRSASLAVKVTPRVVITSFWGQKIDEAKIRLNWDGTDSVEVYHIKAEDIGYSFYSGPLMKQVVIDFPPRAVRYMREARINTVTFSIQALGPGGPATFEPCTVSGLELPEPSMSGDQGY